MKIHTPIQLSKLQNLNLKLYLYAVSQLKMKKIRTSSKHLPMTVTYEKNNYRWYLFTKSS